MKINKICILSDCFVPRKNSAAGMLYNLSKGFVEQNIEIVCVFGSTKYEKSQVKNNKIENYNLENIKIINSNFMSSYREGSYYSRLLFEIGLSLALCFKIFKNRKTFADTDLIIWYSPSAFLWLPALILKKMIKVPLYLILRDIFPDWIINLGLVKNKVLINFLKIITLPQFIIPNIIGCESANDAKNIQKKFLNQNVTTLYNWPSLSIKKNKHDTNIEFVENYKFVQYSYKQHSNAVYTGSNSVSQDLEKGMNFLRDFFCKFDNEFQLVVNQFTPEYYQTEKVEIINKGFIEKKWEMINADVLQEIYKLSEFGVVSLNTKHKTSNIPGKFVSYLQFGLPVLCFANKNSEVSEIIVKNNCGCVIDLEDHLDKNFKLFYNFMEQIKNNKNFYNKNSLTLFNNYFSLKKTIAKLIETKY